MKAACRCRWCNIKSPKYVEYHDTEWGVPRFDDAYLYEILILESFQAGLSWECVLNKREAFRLAYDGFDASKVGAYKEDEICALMQNKDIIRNRRKIESSVSNSRIFLNIVREFGSFYDYLLGFTDGKTVYEVDRVTSPLSDEISKDLRNRGMRFVGSTVIYSFLQAIGIIYSHEKECFLYKSENRKSE